MLQENYDLGKCIIKSISKGPIIIEAIQNFRMKINNRDYPKQQKTIIGICMDGTSYPYDEQAINS